MFLALSSLTSASAQDYRWDFNVGAGYPSSLAYVDAAEGVGTALGEVFAVIFTFGLYKPTNEFERVENTLLPAFAIQGGYQVLPWLQITADAYYHHGTKDYYVKETDSEPGKMIRSNKVSILPGCKFTYLNKGAFKMYSTVSFGGALFFSKTTTVTTDAETGQTSTEITPVTRPRFCVQTVPVGFSVGRAFYGFADFGIGSEYTGFRGGIGYRF